MTRLAVALFLAGYFTSPVARAQPKVSVHCCQRTTFPSSKSQMCAICKSNEFPLAVHEPLYRPWTTTVSPHPRVREIVIRKSLVPHQSARRLLQRSPDFHG